MRQINTGCYGCKYNCNWFCVKDGVCTGCVPFDTYVSNMSEQNYIPANTSIMPDELVINGVKYKKVNCGAEADK